MYEFYVIPAKHIATMTEYFCCSCRQLRLSLTQDKTHCMNCGSKDIVTGSVGSLDKAAMIRKLDGFKG